MNRERIKENIIGKIYLYLRDFYRFPNMVLIKNRISKLGSNSIILLGTPTYNNLGDHLIAISERQFLNNTYKHKDIIEIPTQVFKRYKNEISDVISRDITIFVTGGGWMGSLWPDDEYIMQEMISQFCNNKIVILPQTVYYDLGTDEGNKILLSAKETYKKCINLILCLRDEDSYQFALKHFPIKTDNILFTPDIALYYKKKEREEQKKGILVCLRDDREKVASGNFKEWIRLYTKKYNISYEETDTVVKRSIPIWYRKRKVENIVKRFQNAQVIITDRLHGMIISVIANTKCIVFNNRTNKVYGVYNQWLKNNPNILYLSPQIGEDEFIKCLDELCQPYIYTDFWKKSLIEEFTKLQCELREEI